MATKFVSALTGPEMDQALIDMAYHNSEAYAVGTRNGVAVGSSDVTYHNNAKYYAEQTGADVQAAEAAAARAEAAVPSGTAGAVFFDRAQTLTTAQQEQARANIMAGGSNDNLLDNWYFVGGGSQLGDGVFPINQRGLTSYSANGYGIDRWICYGGAITLAADGLSVPANGVLTQPTGYRLTQLNGETLTLSVLYDSGIETGTAVLDLSGTTMFINNGAAGQTYITNGGLVQTYKGTASKIRAIKLELGTVSTLANDVPPKFWAELANCQRYLFIRDYVQTDLIGHGLSVSATLGIINVTLPVSMRSGGSPTGTFSASPLVYGGGTGEQPSLALNTVVGNTAKFVATMTAGIANTAIVAYAGTNIRLVISNEL